MIEKVVNRKNTLKAYRQVVSNAGSAGVDGMPVKALCGHLRENRPNLILDFPSVNSVRTTLKAIAGKPDFFKWFI